MLPQQGFHVYRERSGPKSLAGDDAFIAERELLSIAEGRTSSFIYNIPAFTGQCMYQYMILKYIPENVLFLLHIYYSNLKGGFHLHFAKITVLTYFKFKVGTLVLREQELSNLAKGCVMVKLTITHYLSKAVLIELMKKLTRLSTMYLTCVFSCIPI